MYAASCKRLRLFSSLLRLVGACNFFSSFEIVDFERSHFLVKSAFFIPDQMSPIMSSFLQIKIAFLLGALSANCTNYNTDSVAPVHNLTVTCTHSTSSFSKVFLRPCCVHVLFTKTPRTIPKTLLLAKKRRAGSKGLKEKEQQKNKENRYKETSNRSNSSTWAENMIQNASL